MLVYKAIGKADSWIYEVFILHSDEETERLEPGSLLRQVLVSELAILFG